ncbi:MAG: hypothetical protein A4E19_19650 [Nitrospira sp. SG-bin1]|nr:MAG: hypothetical protein A4E19_19650 [Nitrospira sp. SG-bin1]
MHVPKSIPSPYQWLPIGLLLFIMTACASSDSPAVIADGTATLSWDASAGADVAGYKIYHATASGAYGAPVATVTMDVTNYTMTGLENGTTYFFVVTAYNTDGAESSFSNEVSKAIL